MSDYWGTRLAVGELPRVTKQVAVTLALAMGRRPDSIKTPTFRLWAAQSMFAALGDSILPWKLNQFDDFGHPVGGAAKLKKEAIEARAKLRLPLDHTDSFETELVLVPLDGANALREGWSGALSLIGAVPPGCFVENDFFGAEKSQVGDSHLAIVVGNTSLAEGHSLKDMLQLHDTGSTELIPWMKGQGLLQDLVRNIRLIDREPVIVTTYPPNWPSSPKSRFPIDGCMVRLLDGSTVGAALAALRNKVSATVCVSRTPQMKLIALATIGLQGLLICVPLVENKTKAARSSTFDVRRPLHVRDQSDFVRGENGILVSSSISEVCFQDRVRFIGQGRASVNTLIVSIASRSLRDIAEELDLRRATFRSPDGDKLIASAELQRFRCHDLGDPGEFGSIP